MTETDSQEYPIVVTRLNGRFRIYEDGDEERIDDKKRIEDLEQSVGKGGGGQRDIAHRIDSLEDDIEEIKEELDMS